jgi:DNA-binding transcriptional regulator YiaG
MEKNWNAEEIKKVRRNLGMNQREFADALGIRRQQTISKWEKGDEGPGLLSRIVLNDFWRRVVDGQVKSKNVRFTPR